MCCFYVSVYTDVKGNIKLGMNMNLNPIYGYLHLYMNVYEKEMHFNLIWKMWKYILETTLFTSLISFFLIPVPLLCQNWRMIFKRKSGRQANKWTEFSSTKDSNFVIHIDGLVQERRNSSALAVELCLSCINLSIYS